jgi:hypothetical protein
LGRIDDDSAEGAVVVLRELVQIPSKCLPLLGCVCEKIDNRPGTLVRMIISINRSWSMQ